MGGDLGKGVDETVVVNFDRIDRALLELLQDETADRLALGEGGAVILFEIGEEVFLHPGEDLAALAADADIDFVGVVIPEDFP